MARRGVIIYGIPRNHKIGEIINFANKLFAVKEYKTVKRNGRTEYHLSFDSEGTLLFEIAQQIKVRFGVNAQVKYLTEPNVEKSQSRDPKDFGNPYIKEPSRSVSTPSGDTNLKRNVSMPKPQNELSSNTKLRIDLDLKDIDSLLEYLKSRPINEQQRKRYRDLKSSESGSIGNKSNRSTFVARDILFDKHKVEVFVNGQRTNDILCWVEEKTDAYILHLFYRSEEGNSKLISIAKSEAKEPIHRIRYSDKNSSISINGKALAITFKGYDGYKRERSKIKSDVDGKESTPSVRYEGQPSRPRRTKIVKQTSVVKGDGQINVKVTDDSNADGDRNASLSNLLTSLAKHNNGQKRQTEPVKDTSEPSDNMPQENVVDSIPNNKEEFETQPKGNDTHNQSSGTESNNETGGGISLSELITMVAENAMNSEQQNSELTEVNTTQEIDQSQGEKDELPTISDSGRHVVNNVTDGQDKPSSDTGCEVEQSTNDTDYEDPSTDNLNEIAPDVFSIHEEEMTMFQKVKRALLSFLHQIIHVFKKR